MTFFPDVAEPVFAVGSLLFVLIMHHRSRERRRRWRLSLCPECGYDIRTRLNRCSECGAAIPKNWRDPSA